MFWTRSAAFVLCTIGALTTMRHVKDEYMPTISVEIVRLSANISNLTFTNFDNKSNATTSVRPSLAAKTLSNLTDVSNRTNSTLLKRLRTSNSTRIRVQGTIAKEPTTTASPPLVDTTDKFYQPKRAYIPPPINNKFYDLMVASGSMNRSAVQQRRFLARKKLLETTFAKSDRYATYPRKSAAYILSNDWIYLHIWKCGGSTVAKQAGKGHVRLTAPEVKGRPMVAFVRDPIDRFLSAWAECGDRQLKNQENRKYESFNEDQLDKDYDVRVRAFLQEVNALVYPKVRPGCQNHALPQSAFLMNDRGQIYKNVQVVGDMTEMNNVLLQIGAFDTWQTNVTSRIASHNTVKQQHFPAHRDWLSNRTIMELCEFLKVDYFLFDFEPPKLCVEEGGPLAKYNL